MAPNLGYLTRRLKLPGAKVRNVARERGWCPWLGKLLITQVADIIACRSMYSSHFPTILIPFLSTKSGTNKCIEDESDSRIMSKRNERKSKEVRKYTIVVDWRPILSPSCHSVWSGCGGYGYLTIMPCGLSIFGAPDSAGIQINKHHVPRRREPQTALNHRRRPNFGTAYD